MVIEEELDAIDEIESLGIELSDTKQSIIVYNSEKNYCLFIDNLKTNLKDKANRPIKHTFLFVGQYKDEAFYRKIIYSYLSTNIFPIFSFYIKEKSLIDFNLSENWSIGVFKQYKEGNTEWKNINSIDSLKTSLVDKILPEPQKNNSIWGKIGISNKYYSEPLLYIRENIAKTKIDELRQKYQKCCVLNLIKGEIDG